jgi:DNA replication protein DnaC
LSFKGIEGHLQAVLEKARESSAGKVIPIREPDDAEEERKSRLRQLVDRYGIPFKDAQRFTGGLLDETEAVAVLRDFQKRTAGGAVVVLSGKPGCGKTTAAAWFVSEGAPKPHPYRTWRPEEHPRFLSAGKLLRLDMYKQADWDSLEHCSVLVLDDLGTEFKDIPGAFMTKFYDLLNSRYAGCGWTVITTNLSRQDFAKRYDARIEDRLREEGRGFVHLKSKSLRK